MNRSRVTGDLASHGNIFVDIANDRVGIGSTIPGQKLSLPDSAKIALGNSADLEIYHDGSHSYIHDGGTGNLKLRSNNFRLSNADESKVSATFVSSGAVELYHNNSKKFETTAAGSQVSGTFAELQFNCLNGTGNQYKFRASGTNSKGFELVDVTLNQRAYLYHNSTYLGGVHHFHTNGTLRFAIEGAHVNIANDTTRLRFGASADLQLWHDGSHSYIDDSGTGNLYIQSNHVNIDSKNGEQFINCIQDGAVELYHDNAKRLETTAYGIDVTGTTGTDGLAVSGVSTHFEQLYVRQTGGSTSTNVVPFRVEAYKGGTTGISTVSYHSSFGIRPEFIFSNGHSGNWNNSAGQTQHWRMLWRAPNETDTTDDVVELKPNTSISGSLNSFTIRVTDNSNGLRNCLNLQANAQYFYRNNTNVLQNDSDGTGIAESLFHINDADTRLRFPSDNTITFDTAGDERLRIDSNGRLLIGHNSVTNISAHTPRLQIQGTDFSSQTLSVVSNTADANPAYLFLSKQRSGAVGGNTIVNNNDRIGEIRFNGHDGTDFGSETAIIASEVDGAPGADDMPGRLVFLTTADGANSPTERLRIKSDGKISVGNAISSDPWSRTGNTNTGVRLAQSTTSYAISANSNEIVAIFNRTSGTGNGTILELKYDNVVVASLASNFNSFTQNITIDSNSSASLGLDRANTSSGAVIDFKTNGSVKWYMGLRGLVNDNFYIRNESGSTDALTILTNGRVGVNHTAPTSPLDVKGADSGINIRSDANDRPHLNMINGSTTMLRISCNGSLVDFGDGNSTARYMKLNPESNHSKIRMQAQTYVDSSSSRGGVYYYGAGFQYTDDQNNDHPILHVQATSNGGGVNNIVVPNSKIIINGKSIGGSGRSWKLTVIKGSGSNIGQVIHHQTYDVYGNGTSEATNYVNALSTYTTNNNLIIVTTSDEPSSHAGSIRTALRDTYGAKDSMYNYFRYAYVFAFRHGYGTLGEQNSIYWSALNTRAGGGQDDIKSVAAINFTVCL